MIAQLATGLLEDSQKQTVPLPCQHGSSKGKRVLTRASIKVANVCLFVQSFFWQGQHDDDDDDDDHANRNIMLVSQARPLYNWVWLKR